MSYTHFAINNLSDVKMQITIKDYKRKLNQRERVHCKVPNSNISIVATIVGKVSLDNLRDTIRKMQIRHPILNSRMEANGSDVYLVGNVNMEIPLKNIPRNGNKQWMDQIIKEHEIPFNLVEGPLIRFILLHSPELSDLIIFCQHSICDGMSLAYLARDIMIFLTNPSMKVESLPIPPIIDEDAIPDDMKPKFVLRLLAPMINKKWEKQEVLFDYYDFKELHKVFWKKYRYKARLIEFSKEKTKMFVEACRKHDVTVNTALIAAFSMAQNRVHEGNPEFLSKFGSAVDLRNIISKPIGEQFGFFAGGQQFEYKFEEKFDLWKTAQKIYEKAKPEKMRKEALISTLNNFKLPASLMEAQFFAAFAHLIPPSSPSFNKMQEFLNDGKNMVIKTVRKKLSKGTQLAMIMTNLGNLKFPEKYGELVLSNLILMPSCSPYTELAIGVITHAGRLRLTLNHMESTISSEKVLKIGEIAMEVITNAI